MLKLKKLLARSLSLTDFDNMVKKSERIVKKEDITVDKAFYTKRFAHRIGFPYINVVHAVESYIDPETNKNYTESEAREILINLGVDVDKDITETAASYQKHQKWLKENPSKICILCNHPEHGHHLFGTDKCQYEGCPCVKFTAMELK